MELWFTEKHTENVKFSIQVDRQLYSSQSGFQRIDIFASEEFGRFLTLDGYMMLTEKDEFIYHEMIVHVPMSVHPCVRNVLVIGGGDGGTVRELARYGDIEHIDLVEIDEEVVTACRKYLRQTACGFDDDRVHVHYEDGLKFVRKYEDAYDLILVDSTDPFGPGEGLFTKEFYGNCYKALKADGRVLFIRMMRQRCRGHTRGSWSPFRSARFTRRIFRHTLQGTGSLALPRRNIIRLTTRT